MRVPNTSRIPSAWNLVTVAVVGIVTFASAAHPANAAVTVSQKGDTLYVNGTRANDLVVIIGVDGHPGNVTVKSDGQSMTAHHGFEHLVVNLGGGNNVLGLLQAHIPGNVTVNAGSGINELILGYEFYMPNLIWGDLAVNCPNGVCEILLEQSWIVGDASFMLGGSGNNLEFGRSDLAADLAAVVFGDLTVNCGDGDDRIEIVKSWFGGAAEFQTAGGNDDVLLGTHYETGSPVAGNIFQGTLVINTGDGEDGVGLTDSAFGGDVEIETGNDDDDLYLGDAPGFPPNVFNGEVDAHGGGGQDFLNNDPGNTYANPPNFHSFELP